MKHKCEPKGGDNKPSYQEYGRCDTCGCDTPDEELEECHGLCYDCLRKYPEQPFFLEAFKKIPLIIQKVLLLRGFNVKKFKAT